MLETALDHKDLVFRYVTDADGRIRIEASILLYTDVDGNQIYVYIDQEKDRNSDYYCRSFVANPSFDRKKGLKKRKRVPEVFLSPVPVHTDHSPFSKLYFQNLPVILPAGQENIMHLSV